MMRRVQAWAKMPLGVQKRFIKFDRHVDDDGSTFYTRAKRHRPWKPMATPEFFMVPDLILDLDAPDSPHVRPFDKQDQERLKAQWQPDPKRAAARARLEQFDQQLQHSRAATHRIRCQPINCWRITGYDLLSAAIRGAPPSKSGHQDSYSVAQVEHDCPSLDKVRFENGIPLHAVEHDEHFLRWMVLRQGAMERSMQSDRLTAPPPREFAKVLHQQKSINAIRRLVLQYLKVSASTSLFRDMSMGQNIQYACERVLKQCRENHNDLTLDVLIFIANLTNRISASDGYLCPHLCGYALVLSARSGAFEAVSEWLRRGHSGHLWTHSQGSKHVLSALASFGSMMNNTAGTQLDSALRRQFLFQILTGIDANDKVLPDSFRAVAMLHLEDKYKLAWREAFPVYEAYVLLLGQLGGCRILWKEWRTSAILAQERMNGGKSKTGDGLACLFQRALRHGVDAMAPADGDEQADAGLGECATLDYHAIGMHKTNKRRDGEGLQELGVAEAKSTLDMPLMQYLERLKMLQSGTVTSKLGHVLQTPTKSTETE
ncbi:hypothetical protein CDD82_7383 [Ophiocordyceps australis]|uniref:Uncharacterized protein n=1 Tax=Ophiocordyceps australis TaxID=1399860 RepID=A0A2C5YT10_9HYPO|nr:hypothetical protein CDD82_7383 [Ophiocordyceps australis]